MAHLRVLSTTCCVERDIHVLDADYDLFVLTLRAPFAEAIAIKRHTTAIANQFPPALTDFTFALGYALRFSMSPIAAVVAKLVIICVFLDN